jgi:hypothetical protein
MALLLLLGVVVFVALRLAGIGFSARRLGGVAALIFAVFLLSRGEIFLAVPAAAAGGWLLGWRPAWMPSWLPPWMPSWLPGFGGRRFNAAGRISRVRSAYLEVELDHDSGVMRGRVLAGRYQGTALDALAAPTLIELLGQIDGDSRQLLLAYLDRREPRWREHAQRDTAAGNGGGAASSGKMTEQEAYQILGLQAGASAQDVARAHRSLIKKLHPDQGGSTYLAARVNEAKDVLLRRHRSDSQH